MSLLLTSSNRTQPYEWLNEYLGWASSLQLKPELAQYWWNWRVMGRTKEDWAGSGEEPEAICTRAGTPPLKHHRCCSISIFPHNPTFTQTSSIQKWIFRPRCKKDGDLHQRWRGVSKPTSSKVTSVFPPILVTRYQHFLLIN